MKYDILMIDPPWPKNKGGLQRVRPMQKKYFDYKTLSVPEIFDILNEEFFRDKVKARHSVFIWTIDSFLRSCELFMDNYGYTRHARLIWDKENVIAPAVTVRFSHEYLLWYYKGKFNPIDNEFRGKYSSVFCGGTRKHSRKPDYAYEMVNKMYPKATKIDLFSRKKREGWDRWGG